MRLLGESCVRPSLVCRRCCFCEFFVRRFCEHPLFSAANLMLPFTLLNATFWKCSSHTSLDDQCWGLGGRRVAGDGDMWIRMDGDGT